MTPFHSHPADLSVRAASRFSVAKAAGRLRAVFKAIHDAIVAAKLRRLQGELTLHERWPAPPDTDAATYPRRALILGDKWDF